LIACPCCSFQEAGKSTLVDLIEYVNRAPSRRPKIICRKGTPWGQVLTWNIKDLTKNMGSQSKKAVIN
jgi:hypothetical protein